MHKFETLRLKNVAENQKQPSRSALRKHFLSKLHKVHKNACDEVFLKITQAFWPAAII